MFKTTITMGLISSGVFVGAMKRRSAAIPVMIRPPPSSTKATLLNISSGVKEICVDTARELTEYAVKILGGDDETFSTLATENTAYFVAARQIPEMKGFFSNLREGFKKYGRGYSLEKLVSSHLVSITVKAVTKLLNDGAFNVDGSAPNAEETNFMISVLITTVIWQLMDSTCKQLGGGDTLKILVTQSLEGLTKGVADLLEFSEQKVGLLLETVLTKNVWDTIWDSLTEFHAYVEELTRRCAKNITTQRVVDGLTSTAETIASMPLRLYRSVSHGSGSGKSKSRLRQKDLKRIKAFQLERSQSSTLTRRRLLDRLQFETLRAARA